MAALFTAEHISKSFHLRAVLQDVSLALHAGETVLLFGRNGTGKTTLLRILAGVMRPEQGRASLDGRPLFTSDSRWRGDMVYLGHRAHLYPDLTARENLQLCLRLRKQTWDEDEFRSALQRHGLYAWRNESIRVYSEGMLQRLG
ncbi:MAG: ATP-binding cassette domain-containing protein, partial [Candidatus Neomarinimicrobiota bacterium]